MEISYRKIIIVLLLGFTFQISLAQTNNTFCKAVAKENFNKIERLVKKQVRHHKKGQRYYNGTGSGYQTNFTLSFDSITTWFKSQNCIDDAYWDKCQNKIAIYPSWSIIGVKFRTKNRTVEKCFSIQQGTTGKINFFGWKPTLFKMKNRLVYRKSYDCKGFIALQKLNCFPYSKKDTIVPVILLC